MSRAPLLCTPIESFNNDWQANIIGPVRLTQLLALLLVHTAARADRGRTVVFNVGTAGGTIAVSWMAAQPAAKVSNF
jgi:NAD(P)-dependent dehydrogenase (short-subunit alcohol dehydrogenase family)